MTTKEFSNEFDILYNSITSNQAPGLDEYEKSVFLTKAQDEVVKAYFNPRTNKTQEGFDGNERRQIDFSMIMKSVKYRAMTVSTTIPPSTTGEIKSMGELLEASSVVNGSTCTITGKVINSTHFNTKSAGSGKYTIDPFLESFFDDRGSSKAVTLEDDVLMFINEYITVGNTENDTNDRRLVVIPINYTEYSRLMSKPYKRPLKNQAWRLLDNSNGVKRSELVVGPNDNIKLYAVRYVKRPRAIRLEKFDEVTLDGANTVQECELDPILHPEILQRAVELAKAAYLGDLNSQIALGHNSQTNVGMVSSK